MLVTLNKVIKSYNEKCHKDQCTGDELGQSRLSPVSDTASLMNTNAILKPGCGNIRVLCVKEVGSVQKVQCVDIFFYWGVLLKAMNIYIHESKETKICFWPCRVSL